MNDIFNFYGALSNVKIITIAPELPDAPCVIEEMTKRGIKISIGKSCLISFKMFELYDFTFTS